jgi:adenylate cyclase
MKLVEELKKRRVFKVAGIYVVALFATLQGMQVLVESLSLPVWIMTVLTLIGVFAFPIVLVLTFVFDVTSDGIQRSPVVTGSRMPLHAGLAIVVVLVGVGAYAMLPNQPERDASVAVLPFVDMSEAKDQEFFGDGITEEILNTLVKVPGLRVPGRTSSFSFKGKNIPITEIAQQLRVAHVLEGSVRTWGDSIRITAQLIDATTDKHVWSEQYDRRSADVFAIQGEIAHAIVEALRLRIKMPEHGSVDARAYESYLKGLYHTRTTSELPQALDAYRAAVRADSNYAAAWAAMALTYAMLPEFTVDFEVAVALREGKAAARKALELDPRNVQAHVALGKLAATYEFDWQTAEQHYAEAMRLEPNSALVLTYIQPFYYMVGRQQETLEVSERAVELDPLNSLAVGNLGWFLWEQGRKADGLAMIKSIVIREPRNLPMRLSLIGMLVLDQRFDEAKSFADTNAIPFLPTLISAVENPAQHAVAHEILGTPKFPGNRGWAWFSIPYYLAMGANDSVATVLDRGVDQYENGMMYYARHPNVIKAVGTHPRFQSYLRKLNLPEVTQ